MRLCLQIHTYVCVFIHTQAQRYLNICFLLYQGSAENYTCQNSQQQSNSPKQSPANKFTLQRIWCFLGHDSCRVRFSKQPSIPPPHKTRSSLQAIINHLQDFQQTHLLYTRSCAVLTWAGGEYAEFLQLGKENSIGTEALKICIHRWIPVPKYCSPSKFIPFYPFEKLILFLPY